MTKISFIILFFSMLLIIPGCLEDKLVTPPQIDINKTAVLLELTESTGEEITADPSPVLIDAEEVFSNIDNYLIIDFRTKEEFNNGHIKNAVNVSNVNLLKFISDNNLSAYPKVICVDADGQSSAYYAALLRLLGFSNVYSLNFGMAIWNIDFSEVWLKAQSEYPGLTRIFTDSGYNKSDFSALPPLNTEAGYDEMKNILVSVLINKGYINTVKDVEDFRAKDYYYVCYGNTNLYYGGKFYPFGHPPNTPLYESGKDLKSINYLQTLPDNQKILIYCYNGQLSSIAMAYLRMLGYDVYVLLYGAEHLFQYRMSSEAGLSPYSFSLSNVKNYPYVK